MTGIRKMVLIEETELQRLKEKHLRDYDPTLNAMARAESDLDAIFGDKDLTDEQKSALIQHAQQRFNNLKSSRGSILQARVEPEHRPNMQQPADPKHEENTNANDVLTSLKEFVDSHPPLPQVSKEFDMLDVKTRSPHLPLYRISKADPLSRKKKSANKISGDPSLASIKTESPLSTTISSIPIADDSPSGKAHIRRSKRRKTLASSSSFFPKQSGTGTIHPPGTKPRLLFLYH